MGPVAVGHRAREEGVLGVDHPVGQLLAGILVRRHCHRLAVQRLDDSRLVSPLVSYGAAGAVEDDQRLLLLVLEAAWFEMLLAAHTAEERGQAPVVVLAPFLVRVMVALSTGETQAEEYLGRVVHELLRVLQLLIPNGGGRFDLVADRPEDFTSEFVIWPVLGYGF